MRRSVLALLLVAACAARESGSSSSSEDITSWEPVSASLGNPPNFAQASNGSLMSVVSRAWGRGAKAGALVELYWPHVTNDNLWDSYVGIRSRGAALAWAHDLTLEDQTVVPDTGRIESRFGGSGVGVTISDVVRPHDDVHLRHVAIVNRGTTPLEDVDLAFYAYYTVGGLPAGDHIESARGGFVQSDGNTSIATLSDRPASIMHCGIPLVDLPWGRDARIAAEKNALVPCAGMNAGIGAVNGVTMHGLGTIAPGATAEITFAIAAASTPAAALDTAQTGLAGGFAARAQEDADRWAADLARAAMPARLDANSREVYRRAIITILQHRVDNGGFIAASTLTSPVYKLVWPRDGSKTAVDMLEAGYVAEAKGFFELLERLQKPDGSFAINYYPDASGPFLDLGAAWNENDEPGMLPWGVSRVYQVTHDRDWIQARFPAIQRVAEHLLSITSTGLLAPSRDLWELETGASWTYSNGAAAAGLDAAIALGKELGQDTARWETGLASLRAAMDAQLVAPDGYFGRGAKDGAVDARLEIANLALGSGGFGLYPDTDPRIAKIGDLVTTRLMTTGNAVRRYEGDKYYGGQPWPVASTWLSLHRLARGDRAGAESLFQTTTAQALATGTHMLGEQFDEAEKRWYSAVPLVWSEAAYLRNAKALYGD